MCGIFSLLNYSTNKIEYSKVSDEFAKGQGRGPENSTLFHDSALNIVTGFHRLAINGLNEASNQPISVITKLDKYSLICNGEIYNHDSLRSQLLSLGAKFLSHSDTEVLLNAYKYWGVECLDKLVGMCAFIIYDKIFFSWKKLCK